MADTPDYDNLEQLANIYGQLTGRDRQSQNGISALDMLEDLLYNEVLKHHNVIFPPDTETETEETETE